MFWKRESMRFGAAVGFAGGVELREKRFSCRLGRASIAVVVLNQVAQLSVSSQTCPQHEAAA